jgi:hypothetical protein
MELRSRIPAYARRAAVMAAFGALLAPATAGAATATTAAKKKVKKYPTISSVRPMDAHIGDTITIRGRNFKPGRGKNSVIFKRDGGRAVFVKADVGTKKLLKVKLPAKLNGSLAVVNGAPTTTRFRLRVLAQRLGKKFTSARMSPRVGPEVPPPPPESESKLDPDGDCDGDKVVNRTDADDDNDGLDDGLEGSLGTDACKFDSDLDKVSDGFEHRSAIDLNNDDYRNPAATLPYPGKKPYPNALDGTDAGTDYDGDGMTLGDEYGLWQYTIGRGGSASLTALSYSDGLKYSVYTRDATGIRRPGLPAAGYEKAVEFTNWLASSGYQTVQLPDENDEPGEHVTRPLLDFNRNGLVTASESSFLDISGDTFLSDDERDEDGDGLSNWVELHGYSTPGWWTDVYNRETPFRITYAGTVATDADTDGDGVRDGADDQDHDDYANIVELSRSRVSGRGFDPPKLNKGLADPSPWYGRVQPFNPCEPNVDSRTCPTYTPLEEPYAPFDGPPWNPDGDDPNYLVLN